LRLPIFAESGKEKEQLMNTAKIISPRGDLSSATAVQTVHVPQKVEDGIRIEKSVFIFRPVAEVFSFWRNFENLPSIMSHVESIQVTGATRSHWVIKGPVGSNLEWDAEITEERENECIAWCSLEGSEVANKGYVKFESTLEGRGTDLTVNLRYDPPAGKFGAWVAKVFGEDPEQQIEEDLNDFKELLEANGRAETQELEAYTS
jgi:uncharacterized membrane protein